MSRAAALVDALEAREYRFHRVRGGVLVARPPWTEPEPAALIDALAQAAPAGVAGRGELRAFVWRGTPLLVRAYRTGGWLRRWRSAARFDPRRPLRELLHLDLARAAGVPVAEPAFLWWAQARGGRWRGPALATLQLPGEDLLAHLRRRGGRPGRDVVRAAAEAVRRLHEAGIAHADLNLRNLFVRPAGAVPRVVILDLDRSLRRPPLPAAHRWANLRRLGRSLGKAERLEPLTVPPRDALRFFREYAGEDRSLWRRAPTLARRIARDIRLHGLLWRA